MMTMMMVACANRSVAEQSSEAPTEEGPPEVVAEAPKKTHLEDGLGTTPPTAPAEPARFVVTQDPQTSIITGSFLYEDQRFAFEVRPGNAASLRVGSEPLAEWTLADAESTRVIGRIGPYSIFGDERDIAPTEVRACREGALVIELRDRIQAVGLDALLKEYGPGIGVLTAAGDLIAPAP